MQGQDLELQEKALSNTEARDEDIFIKINVFSDEDRVTTGKPCILKLYLLNIYVPDAVLIITYGSSDDLI